MMIQECKKLSLDDAFSKDVATAVVRSMRETFAADVLVETTEYGEGIVSLSGDISGIICLVQEHLDGTLILSMPHDTVKGLLPRVLGKDATVTQDMIIDAVGELTNMLFGQVKNELNQRMHRIKLGIPCVVTGKGHFVCQFHRGRYMIVPFYLEGALFQVYVALHDGRE